MGRVGSTGPGWAPLPDMLTFFLVSGGSLWLLAGKSLLVLICYPQPWHAVRVLILSGGEPPAPAAKPSLQALFLQAAQVTTPQILAGSGRVWEAACGSAEMRELALRDPTTTSLQFSYPYSPHGEDYSLIRLGPELIRLPRPSSGTDLVHPCLSLGPGN